MANLKDISDYLDKILDSQSFIDESQNGLQVESNSGEISKIAFAVDSGLSIIEKCIKLKCKLLVVHHGLFWNKPYLLNGILAKKIRLLMENGCSVYASHLPLDGSLKYGNAALVAKYLKLIDIKPFCLYKSNFIGIKASSSKPLEISQIVEKCKLMRGSIQPIVLPFGKKDIKKIGIVTGSGSMAIEDCANEGLDLLISGEAKQSAFHHAKELCINAIFAGHYATETFGVLGLAKELERKFKIKSFFIDEATGI